ncbi:J domain-containing protein [Rhodovibrionaceae bacterium A322]
MASSSPQALEAPLRKNSADSQPAERLCAHPECQELGAYKAPADRSALHSYIWFCLEHVRAYNQAWDFFAGQGQEAVDAQRRRDQVWDRPTWRMGEIPVATEDPEIHDGFAAFSGRRRNRAGGQEPSDYLEVTSDAGQALDCLGLSPPITAQEVKVRYKELVKSLHPDTNGGGKKAEERLKRVNQAYSTLKALYS